MRLDAAMLRYLAPADFRLLAALEVGSRNHEYVPVELLAKLANSKPCAVLRGMSDLARYSLVAKSLVGFRLAYGGYDYLALHALAARNTVLSVGRRIGVGKESDVYLAIPPPPDAGGKTDPCEVALKIHRLGRVCFRNVRTKRAFYQRADAGKTSWIYYSRIAATREFAYLQVLSRHGFPVPAPISANRHCVVMEYLKGCVPLVQFPRLINLDYKTSKEQPNDSDSDNDNDNDNSDDNDEEEDEAGEEEDGKWSDDDGSEALGVDVPDEMPPFNPEEMYVSLMFWLVKLARHGLVHGDYNEFNIMVKLEDYSVVIIDFPQMLPISDPLAKEYFERDVEGICTFFVKAFGYHPLPEAIPSWDSLGLGSGVAELQDLYPEFLQLTKPSSSSSSSSSSSCANNSKSRSSHKTKARGRITASPPNAVSM